jgi:hypothetical protein
MSLEELERSLKSIYLWMWNEPWGEIILSSIMAHNLLAKAKGKGAEHANAWPACQYPGWPAALLARDGQWALAEGLDA